MSEVSLPISVKVRVVKRERPKQYLIAVAQQMIAPEIKLLDGIYQIWTKHHT